MENSKELPPKIRLATIIFKPNNEVLLGKTKLYPDSGRWIFPGGEMEFADSYHRTIFTNLWRTIGIRQTDILLTDESPSVVTNDIYENIHYVTLYCRAKHYKRRPGIRDKSAYEELNWFRWDNLPSPLSLQIENFLKQKYNPHP